MSATYYPVSIEEMRDFLKSDKGWREETSGNAKEKVFQYPLPKRPNILIKVYSGITDAGSRKCGCDAIRVCAVNTATNPVEGWIKSKRVHRVTGWRDNLKSRVCQVIRQAKARTI